MSRNGRCQIRRGDVGEVWEARDEVDKGLVRVESETWDGWDGMIAWQLKMMTPI